MNPISGWGWSYRTGKRSAVPPPFILEAVVTEVDEFKTAVGRNEQTSHPLASMWILLSPIIAGNAWELSHVFAFTEQPSIADDVNKVKEAVGKVNLLENVNAAAEVTGFAHVVVETEQP